MITLLFSNTIIATQKWKQHMSAGGNIWGLITGIVCQVASNNRATEVVSVD